jgi:hypothetical protein
MRNVAPPVQRMPGGDSVRGLTPEFPCGPELGVLELAIVVPAETSPRLRLFIYLPEMHRLSLRGGNEPLMALSCIFYFGLIPRWQHSCQLDQLEVRSGIRP